MDNKNVYNVASIDKIEKNLNEPICNRGKVNSGFFCNYDCSFCYYKKHLTEKTSFDVIKKRVDYLVECGIDEFDLSGGESTILPFWFELLDYIKSKPHKRISCLTNGSILANYDFFKKSKEHGLEEVLFSLHGHNEEVHDKIVGRKGAFNKMLKAIENAKQLDIMIRINCTVCVENKDHLEKEYFELLDMIKPFEVNFITLNYWHDANKQEPIDYTEITKEIKTTIDKVKSFIPIINVRYTPFCFMKGYEEYVCNTYQHVYDPYDWNIGVYNENRTPEEYKKDKLQALYDQAANDRLQTSWKNKECLRCKHYYICDGFEKQIDMKVESDEGEKITDPMFYSKGFYNKY